MRFEEAYEGWNTGRLAQAEAARVLEMCECGFRRYLSKSIGDSKTNQRLIERSPPMIEEYQRFIRGSRATTVDLDLALDAPCGYWRDGH